MNEKNVNPPISDEKRKNQQSENQKPVQLGQNREGGFQQKSQDKGQQSQGQTKSYNEDRETDTRGRNASMGSNTSNQGGPRAEADDSENLDTAEGNKMRKSGT